MRATVLVADDDENIRDALSWCLRIAGFRVLTAGDGAEAVRRSAKAAVDLFILDLHMPNLDGAGALAAIRAKPRFRTTPILFLTGQPHHAPAGVPVLAKPCDAEELLGAVRALLTRPNHRSISSAKRQAAAGLTRGSRKPARFRLQVRHREA
jgi:DNA-binding response OmpR family regulator